MEDEGLKALATFFCRHLVVLSGTWVEVDENGQTKGDDRFYFYTGTVLSIRDQWHIATAGHVFDDLERQLKTGRVRILSQTLVDYFGPGGGFPLPIPFDFVSAPKVWRYDSGLDFALIPVSPLFRANLEASGVVPFFEPTWNPPGDVQFYQYRLLGCPEYLTRSTRMASDQPMTGFVEPVFAVIHRLPDDTTERHPRFAGTIQAGLQNVEGMSGGPILGIAKHNGQTAYWIMALQSRWLPTSRKVFGCPLTEFLPIADRMLERLALPPTESESNP